MLPFPPVGRAVRTTIQYARCDGEPVRILEYNRNRLFAVFYYDNGTADFAVFGRTAQGVNQNIDLSLQGTTPLVFYGPEELWMAANDTPGAGHTGGLVHAVYWDE